MQTVPTQESIEACFIMNPVAGRGRARVLWESLHESVKAQGVDAVVRQSQGPGHPRELAEHAAREGFPLVVAIGGDGTIHEVVNGLMAAGSCRAALAVIPCGTGNDFARNLGLLHRRPDDVVAALASRQYRTIDLGKVNGRYFINMAGVGFNAEVARRAGTLPTFVPGALNYVLGVMGALIAYAPHTVQLELDGQRWSASAFMVHVANTVQCAGGMQLCPDASYEDGELDILILGQLGRLETMRLLPKTFSGRHVGHPKVSQYRGKKLVVESRLPIPLQADGELLGWSPATFEVVPRALDVLVV